MKVLQRYLASEILRAVVFVLAAFLALFAFFDLTGELKSVGQGGYGLQHVFLYVLLGMPSYAYMLMPISALIGTIYALSQLASRSEFTIMRVSSMSTLMVAGMLAKIGLLIAFVTFIFGEFISPFSTQLADQMKLQAQGASISQEFRSGVWTKDTIKESGLTGAVVGSRFLNVREIRVDGQLLDVKLYEFDREFHLSALITAARGDYQGGKTWRLSDVSETLFDGTVSGTNKQSPVKSSRLASKDFVSEITPDILSVLRADPDRMSANELAVYTKHLSENKQETERYEIAFWKKIIYPFAVFVMMALALPFAYLHFRTGGVSLKIFTGIMIGVSFELLNALFSHLGILNTWPALATAIAPSALFFLAAISALWWVERH
ncbi:MAG: LPS export ABC transporter permease LptG [Pseudomonadota bacterium]